MKLILLVFYFLFSNPVFSNVLEKSLKEHSSRGESSLSKIGSFGHNISPNSYTLNKYEVAVGPYSTAVGVTDKLMIGFSPWIYSSYNSDNFIFRYNLSNFINKTSFQFIYIKTHNPPQIPEDKYDSFPTANYEMEVYKYYLTHTIKHSSNFKSHYSATFDYYQNETIPYSLRRESYNNDPYQINISSLSEISFSNSSIVQLEYGVLGANYFYPQIILGTSIGKKFNSSFFQFGISTTGTFLSYFSPEKREYWDGMKDGAITRDDVKNDFSVHPEMQWQYFF